MKSFFSALLILSFSTNVHAQKEIKIEEAKDNEGNVVKICTKVMDVVFDEKSKGSPTWLYTSTDKNYPFAFVIWGEKRKNFDYKPEKDLKEREVCIVGKIEILKEKPVLVIDKQSQIDIK